MENLQEYINSGMLEEFVLGLTSEAENIEVRKLSIQYPAIQSEIDSIAESLIAYAEMASPEPDPTIKPMVMAMIDYKERLTGGEVPSFLPELQEHSRISDFEEWLHKKEMTLPEDFEEIYVKIMGFEPAKTTALVWLKHGSPKEIHHAEFEKFLILEGSCDLRIEDKIYSLTAGDYLKIPLHVYHEVKVTSPVPCKVILQRIAA